MLVIYLLGILNKTKKQINYWKFITDSAVSRQMNRDKELFANSDNFYARKI